MPIEQNLIPTQYFRSLFGHASFEGLKDVKGLNKARKGITVEVFEEKVLRGGCSPALPTDD